MYRLALELVYFECVCI
ncbi:hypothetical protein F383_25436 [Gossypium arboreum]|uniref:Uncharacterized protein n=1 Tax=Gossypium arboreum TaxID=29729 RepID=A0A0B0MRP4_GOSAR|nr:hypothetical protein F383_25436 [Gossypium arboreum]